MTDQQKKFVVKLMCNRIVEKYMQKFNRELYRKVKKSQNQILNYVNVPVRKNIFFLGENDAIKTVTFSYVFEPCKCVECNIDTKKKESEKTNEEIFVTQD